MDTWWYSSATQLQTQIRTEPGELTKYRQREAVPADHGASAPTYGAWSDWRPIPQGHGISSFLLGLGGMQGSVSFHA